MEYETEKELRAMLDAYEGKSGFSCEQLHPPLQEMTDSLEDIFEIQAHFPRNILSP